MAASSRVLELLSTNEEVLSSAVAGRTLSEHHTIGPRPKGYEGVSIPLSPPVVCSSIQSPSQSSGMSPPHLLAHPPTSRPPLNPPQLHLSHHNKATPGSSVASPSLAPRFTSGGVSPQRQSSGGHGRPSILLPTDRDRCVDALRALKATTALATHMDDLTKSLRYANDDMTGMAIRSLIRGELWRCLGYRGSPDDGRLGDRAVVEDEVVMVGKELAAAAAAAHPTPQAHASTESMGAIRSRPHFVTPKSSALTPPIPSRASTPQVDDIHLPDVIDVSSATTSLVPVEEDEPGHRLLRQLIGKSSLDDPVVRSQLLATPVVEVDRKRTLQGVGPHRSAPVLRSSLSYLLQTLASLDAMIDGHKYLSANVLPVPLEQPFVPLDAPRRKTRSLWEALQQFVERNRGRLKVASLIQTATKDNAMLNANRIGELGVDCSRSHDFIIRQLLGEEEVRVSRGVVLHVIGMMMYDLLRADVELVRRRLAVALSFAERHRANPQRTDFDQLQCILLIPQLVEGLNAGVTMAAQLHAHHRARLGRTIVGGLRELHRYNREVLRWNAHVSRLQHRHQVSLLRTWQSGLTLLDALRRRAVTIESHTEMCVRLQLFEAQSSVMDLLRFNDDLVLRYKQRLCAVLGLRFDSISESDWNQWKVDLNQTKGRRGSSSMDATSEAGSHSRRGSIAVSSSASPSRRGSVADPPLLRSQSTVALEPESSAPRVRFKLYGEARDTSRVDDYVRILESESYAHLSLLTDVLDCLTARGILEHRLEMFRNELRIKQQQGKRKRKKGGLAKRRKSSSVTLKQQSASDGLSDEETDGVRSLTIAHEEDLAQCVRSGGPARNCAVALLAATRELAMSLFHEETNWNSRVLDSDDEEEEHNGDEGHEGAALNADDDEEPFQRRREPSFEAGSVSSRRSSVASLMRSLGDTAKPPFFREVLDKNIEKRQMANNALDEVESLVVSWKVPQVFTLPSTTIGDEIVAAASSVGPLSSAATASADIFVETETDIHALLEKSALLPPALSSLSPNGLSQATANAGEGRPTAVVPVLRPGFPIVTAALQPEAIDSQDSAANPLPTKTTEEMASWTARHLTGLLRLGVVPFWYRRRREMSSAVSQQQQSSCDATPSANATTLLQSPTAADDNQQPFSFLPPQPPSSSLRPTGNGHGSARPAVRLSSAAQWRHKMAQITDFSRPQTASSSAGNSVDVDHWTPKKPFR